MLKATILLVGFMIFLLAFGWWIRKKEASKPHS